MLTIQQLGEDIQNLVPRGTKVETPHWSDPLSGGRERIIIFVPEKFARDYHVTAILPMPRAFGLFVRIGCTDWAVLKEAGMELKQKRFSKYAVLTVNGVNFLLYPHKKTQGFRWTILAEHVAG
jgi:hypothetical protein